MSNPAPQSSTVSKAAIGGIACGAVGAIALFGLIIFFFLRRRSNLIAESKKEQNPMDNQVFAENRPEGEIGIQAQTPPNLPPINANTRAVTSEKMSPTQAMNSFDFNLFPSPPRNHTIRQINEETENFSNDTIPAPDKNQIPSSNSVNHYQLPVITISDQSFPMPKSLLSPQLTFDRPESTSEGEYQDQLTGLPSKSSILSPRPFQSHMRKLSQHTTPAEMVDIFSGVPGSNTTSHSDFYLANRSNIYTPIKEKGRESPVLGVMNTVKITDDSSSTHRNSYGICRRESETSKGSVNSLDQHIISDEELDRLGVGPRI